MTIETGDKIANMLWTMFLSLPFKVMLMMLGLTLIGIGIKELKKQYL